MAGLVDRLKTGFADLRERRPAVDHVVRMQQHYGAVEANQQAAAVTYFAFLSVFPILALAFFVIGYVSILYPDANQNLLDAIDAVLPGLVGNDDGQISLDSVRTFSGLAGIIGVVGVLYTGLSWISALRDALERVFEKPAGEQPGFVPGKLRDLLALGVIGLGLLVSVAVTGFVSAASSTVLDLLGLGDQLAWLVKLVAIVIGLAANAVLFFAVFEILGDPHAPRRSVLQGALLGAVGFEVLKQASSYLLASTKSQPAFQAFGIALILLVWINYFSRLLLYSAAFAQTSAAARALRHEDLQAPDPMIPVVVPGRSKQPDPSVSAPPREPVGAWRSGFVDRIDAADPDQVGPASAAASRAAQQVDRTDATKRFAVGAALTAAGVAALELWHRRDA